MVICYRSRMDSEEQNPLAFRPAKGWVFASLLTITLAGCDQSTPKPQPAGEGQAIAPPPAVAASQPRALPVLSRGDLISAIGQAASDYAGGVDHEDTDILVGRTFSVSIAFGCAGPATGPAAGSTGGRAEPGNTPGLAHWLWGPDRKTIELRMTPDNWTGTNLVAGSADVPEWEAVEGFWITRPWLASEACPLVRGDAVAANSASSSPQSAGLAAVFETGSSRIGRRNGRAYSHIVRAEGDTPLTVPTQGFRLVLEGRTTSFPNGRAVRCRSSGPDQRPVCVVATMLDRVAFEEADGKMLAEWRPG